MSYLGLDIGTSSVKGLVVNEIGSILASDKIAHNYLSPRKGWVELDPSIILLNIKKLIKNLTSQVKKKNPVRSISFSAVGSAFVPIDKNGKCLYNAISALDTRAKEYLSWFEKRGVDNFDIYRITGQPRKVISLLHNILWLKERMGKSFYKIHKFLSLKDLFIYEISSKAVTDYTQASRTMFYDFRDKKWSQYICDLLDIDIDIFPSIIPSYEIVSDFLSKSSCEKLNISRDTKITVGAHDTECCALGANIIKPEDIVITLGTYEELMNIESTFDPSPECYSNNIIIEEHVIEGKFIYYSVFYTGLILDWVMKVFFSDLKGKVINSFDDIFSKLSKDVSDILVIPYLKGTGSPDFNDDKKATITGLTIESNKLDIVKSFVEGLNICIKKLIESTIQRRVKNIFVLGGGSQSDFILQNKANIINHKLNLLNIAESGSFGAAMIACFSDTNYNSFEEMFKVFKNKVIKEYIPEKKYVEAYQKKIKSVENYMIFTK